MTLTPCNWTLQSLQTSCERLQICKLDTNKMFIRIIVLNEISFTTTIRIDYKIYRYTYKLICTLKLTKLHHSIVWTLQLICQSIKHNIISVRTQGERCCEIRHIAVYRSKCFTREIRTCRIMSRRCQWVLCTAFTWFCSNRISSHCFALVVFLHLFSK